MKFIKLLLLLIYLTNSGFGQKKSDYQKIALDEHYSHLKKNEAKDKTTYNFKIKKTNGIILDCSKFDFSQIIQLNKNTNPDLIFIIAKNGTYTIPLNMTGETVIDKTTMTPVSDKRNFSGFKAGDTPIIGIGTIDKTSSTVSLKTFWVSMIDVE